MPHLPGFNSVRNPQPGSGHASELPSNTQSHDSKVRKSKHGITGPQKWQLHRATRTRKIFAILSSCFFLISIVCLVLVEVGNTYNLPVLRSTYFISLDLSNVVPESFPNAFLLNSIARTLGLHDFYQVGLWNYCEGYNNQGVTSCTSPSTNYWFEPVEIIVSQLLAGATIALPTQITDILNLIQTASRWMFACFLTGACLSFVMLFLSPLAIFSRWLTFLVMLPAFAAALFTTAGAIIATAMFIIMRNVFQDNSQVNIIPKIGVEMFAFMWAASTFALFAFAIQLCLMCCCASRRDVRTGRKRGNEKAYVGGGSEDGTEE